MVMVSTTKLGPLPAKLITNETFSEYCENFVETLTALDKTLQCRVSPQPVGPGLLIEERKQHSLLRADVLLPAKTVTGVECRVHKTYLGPGARPVEARHGC